jgi:two-component system sensor histidine kinase RegB
MWVAFGLAACFIVYFIKRVLSELRSIEQQLAAARERTQRSEAVAAMAMLAAGAAHELASPLATIAVASGELLRRFPPDSADATARDDVVLIRTQVERCKEILDQLAVEAGQVRSSSFGDVGWQAILEQGLGGLDTRRLRLSTPEGQQAKLRGSLTAAAQALRSLVKNALDASAPQGVVRLTVSGGPDALGFVVEDDGPGMSEAVLARATEPFFTTKPSGEGMGLGLFLAQSVAEQMGGRLQLSSTTGRGTRAQLLFPLTATNGRMAHGVEPTHALPADA